MDRLQSRPRPRLPPGTGQAPRRQAGVTLLELCLVLGIVALAAGWAVPGLDTLMARQDVATDVMRLKESLATARHTAISRGTVITLCPSDDGVTCGENWTGPLSILAGEMHQPPEQRRLLGRRRPSRLEAIDYRRDQRPVRYKPDGSATGHNGTFRLCGRDGEGASVIVSNFGRVRVDEATPTDC
ncbi:GspH/FimT family pseudopilin [Halomonas sp. 18H]|uniref:GspH/FimT family pseudopilin n=1 Tax=Halomonas almeriensis TaxID=308163 RepID=UPI0022313043|nr:MULTISPECIES: GspH/FimT family pseudopilin [Halomonas]MCW4149757.1 GspH/FimT family pseudopilin [Halomonas sp. 18H]MDN3553299.1 GspH/FimT family pseudopilin [Halomonas almeriensis]